MSCRTFRREWQPGESDSHAAGCGACAEWVSAQRDLSSALSRLATQLDVAPPPSREAGLRAAFRGSHRSALRGPHFGRFLGWAAAAGFVGLLVLFARGPYSSGLGKRAQAPALEPSAALVAPSAKPRPSSEPKRHVRRAAPATPARVPSAAAPLLPDGPPPEAAAVSNPLAGPSDVASDLASDVALADEDATEDAPERVASDQSFYPLVPDREPSAIDSGQIVRVQLRPDVLSAAGVPSRTFGSGPVEAEVLMGPDGVALGIRLPRRKR